MATGPTTAMVDGVDELLGVAARRALRRSLQAWGDRHRRDLPWRQTRDPWSVLVAELMLQQTQVARVVQRWGPFLERFPDTATCAAAPAGEVIAAWSGLGYNRRAVFLHRAAGTVERSHGGRFPATLDVLLALPGVGGYTARAVLAFAFEHDIGVLDTNVGRVLARVCGRSLTKAEAQRLADALVPRGGGWRWNQTMLDLGATVCTARAPACGSCPLRRRCSWASAGCTDPDPARGSAAVSGRQSRFSGSDRQGRGRLVAELGRSGRIARADIPAAAGWPTDPERAERVAESLVADGLARWSARGASLVLP